MVSHISFGKNILKACISSGFLGPEATDVKRSHHPHCPAALGQHSCSLQSGFWNCRRVPSEKMRASSGFSFLSLPKVFDSFLHLPFITFPAQQTPHILSHGHDDAHYAFISRLRSFSLLLLYIASLPSSLFSLLLLYTPLTSQVASFCLSKKIEMLNIGMSRIRQ